MSHDPDSRIGSQHPFELIGGLRRAICDQTHSGVNAVAHSNTSALMHTHPSRASRRVPKRVPDRPISHSITTVKHSLGLSPRRGNASTIKMIPSNPDLTRQLPIRNHLLYHHPHLLPLS